MNSEQRQCLANVQAVLNSYNLPSLDPISVEQDRCRFKFSRPFLHNLAHICFEQRLFAWCSMKVVMHTPVRCYREKILRYSTKITVYGENKIEIVFDEWNPCYRTWQRAGAAFMHMLEVMRQRISGRKSDPFKIAQDLRGRGIRLIAQELTQSRKDPKTQEMAIRMPLTKEYPPSRSGHCRAP
jgi:hypothetical protein